ncbi:MAG: hypothetical protein KKG59_02210 [Nanoarchaeota archaeon]|nr:hypothetical protein [Nanoarchaeota archaeon]
MKNVIFAVLLVLFSACSQQPTISYSVEDETEETIREIFTREDKIPQDAVKITPEMDVSPPILHSDDFEEPVPLAVINSAGAEDSPFIPNDRNELYFFFTPDVKVPIDKQLFDGVTGIYVSKNENGAWQEPARVWLQDPGKLSLDGCEFVQGNEMYFCTAREGYTGLHWGTAIWQDDEWTDWQVNDFPEEYAVGELHFTSDMNGVYFHSTRQGGKGENDVWYMEKRDSIWQEPVNVDAVNSEVGEGWPYLTPDGNELWINRWYMGTPGVFRSKKIDGEWQEPELIVSMFAGEPTLDSEGNLYFVHHYYKDNEMLEADIYVAYRK